LAGALTRRSRKSIRFTGFQNSGFNHGIHGKARNEIVHGKRAITADTALRLGKFFGMTPQFWLNLQNRYDLEVAEDALKNKLDKEVHVYRENAA
jgi:plasmid maintenance system antidote protein VapI